MSARLHLQLIAAILVVTSIVAFAPRVQSPHLRLSCRSSQSLLSGAKRFTDNSSHPPDLKTNCSVRRVSLPELEQTPEHQTARHLLNFKFAAPPVRPLIRRFKLRLARADSPVPL
jgi:hypothetical protein